MKSKNILLINICVSMFLACIVGLYYPNFAKSLSPLGVGFSRILKMITVPLVLTSIIVALTNINKLFNLKQVSWKTILYFLITSITTILIGLACYNLYNPTVPSSFQKNEFNESFYLDSKSPFFNERFIELIVPSNILTPLLEDNLLGVILIAILLGLAINTLGKKSEQLIHLFDNLNNILLKITNWLIHLAPIGIFAILSVFIANTNYALIKELKIFILLVLSAITIYAFFILPLILLFIGKKSPLKLFREMGLALITGFFTTSSQATLPITLKCLEKNAKIPKHIASFVAPLGTVINMNGTACYQIITTLFLADIYNIQLEPIHYFTIGIMVLISSIATVGIPSAGLFSLVIIFNSIGIPIEGIAIIIGVDKILDMYRTSVNIWGNSCAATIINRFDKLS